MTLTLLILVYICLYKGSKDGKISLYNCIMTNLISKENLRDFQFNIELVNVPGESLL